MTAHVLTLCHHSPAARRTIFLLAPRWETLYWSNDPYWWPSPPPVRGQVIFSYGWVNVWHRKVISLKLSIQCQKVDTILFHKKCQPQLLYIYKKITFPMLWRVICDPSSWVVFPGSSTESLTGNPYRFAFPMAPRGTEGAHVQSFRCKIKGPEPFKKSIICSFAFVSHPRRGLWFPWQWYLATMLGSLPGTGIESCEAKICLSEVMKSSLCKHFYLSSP